LIGSRERVRHRLLAFPVLTALASFFLAVLALPARSVSAPGVVHAAPESPIARAAFLPRGVVLRTGEGATRLVLQPGGHYGVLVFRDGVRGEHIAIVYHGAMPADSDGAWSLDDRVWQEPLWSADANALVWSPDGSALYVSTGDHGSGSVFRLDLGARRARRLWPDGDASSAEQGAGRSCEMMSADAARRLLRVRYQPAAMRPPIAVDVRMD